MMMMMTVILHGDHCLILCFRFSPTYKKVVFREYDKNFKQAKSRPPWLGKLLFVLLSLRKPFYLIIVW